MILYQNGKLNVRTQNYSKLNDVSHLEIQSIITVINIKEKHKKIISYAIYAISVVKRWGIDIVIVLNYFTEDQWLTITDDSNYLLDITSIITGLRIAWWKGSVHISICSWRPSNQHKLCRLRYSSGYW